MFLADIPYTGYNSELLENHNLSQKVMACGFNMIAAHIRFKITSPTTQELQREAIYESGVEHPELQPNTIYFYCDMKEIDPDSSMLNALKGGSNLDYVPETILIPDVNHIEQEIINIRYKIRKDVTFCNQVGTEIGWYNLYTNIAWLSDLGYSHERFYGQHLPQILDAIMSFQQHGKYEQELNIIGADPEFEIVDLASGNLILPTQYIDDPEFNKPIGIDHYPEIGELRPKPAPSPLALSRNIKRLIRQLIRDVIPPQDTIAIYSGGGTRRNTGGHLHFGVNLQLPHVRHILHDLVSQYVRISISTNRKNEGRYMDRDGRDVVRRAEAHNGWEWRALPSFLVSQDIANILITVVWAVLDSVVNNIITEKEVASTDAPTILRKLRLYSFYKEQIEKFIEMFVQSKTKLEGVDIRNGWPIIASRQRSNIFVNSRIRWISATFPPILVHTNRDNITLRISIDQGNDVLLIYAPRQRLVKPITNILERTFVPHMIPSRAMHDKGMVDVDLYIALPRIFTYEQIEGQPYFPQLRDTFQVFMQDICIELIKIKEEE